MASALGLAERSDPAGTPWALCPLPFTFAADGGREWEEDVRQLYRDKYGVLASHVADHTARGQSLVGEEQDFVVRCNC